jgi:hypothetical protein
MLYYVILCYAMFYYMMLCYVILYSILLYCILFYSILLYYILLYYTILYCIVLHYIISYHIIRRILIYYIYMCVFVCAFAVNAYIDRKPSHENITILPDCYQLIERICESRSTCMVWHVWYVVKRTFP